MSLPLIVVSILLGAPPRGGSDDVPIVFVSRAFDLTASIVDRETVVARASWGLLLVLESDGALRALVDAREPEAPPGAPTDVLDPDVSYDAKTIVFSGLSPVENAFRIYEIRADGFGLRQITKSDRDLDLSRYGSAAPLLEGYDDLDPCYLPDGRICFVSTRYPSIAPDDRRRATNLYVINADGSGLRRITTERFGGDDPAVDPQTGRIVYSRWWRSAEPRNPHGGLRPSIEPGSPGYERAAPPASKDAVLRGIEDGEFPGVNHWIVSIIDPDGGGLAMFTGNGLDRATTQGHRPAFSTKHIATLFNPATPIHGVPGRDGLRIGERGRLPEAPKGVSGPQSFPGTPHAGGDGDFLYDSAVFLPEMGEGEGMIASARLVWRQDYGLYRLSPRGRWEDDFRAECFVDLNGTSELDPVPLAPRALPPRVEDRFRAALPDVAPRDVDEAFKGGTFKFICENIHFNGPPVLPGGGAPPVGKRLSIEFYASPQRTGVAPSDPPLLIHRAEVGPDGRVEAELPAGVPLFEVLRRGDGLIPVGRDGQIFHTAGFNFGRPGQTARCVGCHAGHTLVPIPEEPAWMNLAPSAVVKASAALSADQGPENLVDRSLETSWISTADVEPAHTVSFQWPVRLLGRAVVLYGPRDAGDHLIPFFRIRLQCREDGCAESRHFDVPIKPEGTSVPLPQDVEFDRLQVVIPAMSVDGRFLGRFLSSLAEVEVIARPAPGALPAKVSFVRGDSNCDASVDLTDAVRIIDSRFLGAGSLCCEAAGDANADGEVGISDAVYLVSHLFLAGEPPSAPFPDCGWVTEGAVLCEEQVCSG